MEEFIHENKFEVVTSFVGNYRINLEEEFHPFLVYVINKRDKEGKYLPVLKEASEKGLGHKIHIFLM